MKKPFRDEFEVVQLEKVNCGHLKALVTFRSTRTGRRLGRAELHADKLVVWLIVAGEEDLGNPEVLGRHIYKSLGEKLRLTTNHGMKQMKMRLAVCRYLGLSDEAVWCLPDDGMQLYFCSRRWRKWGPPLADAIPA
jgi:hypothetical protein